MGNVLQEHPSGSLTIAVPAAMVALGVRPDSFRDRTPGRDVFGAPAPAGFGLDLQDGSTAWRTLLERVALLSARELEVLLLLGAGASNRSIANRLSVAERTVKAHVAQVMAKLSVESRLQAGLVSLVFQMGEDSNAR